MKRLIVLIACAASFAAGAWIGSRVDNTSKLPQVIAVSSCSEALLTVSRAGKPVAWGALGDSYSAGVGGPLRSQFWDRDVTNAYGVAASAQFRDPRGLGIQLNLSACGGAKIPEVVGRLTAASVAKAKLDNDWWRDAPPPLRALRGADVATVTLGGNDAGFGNLVNDCLVGECDAIISGGTAGDIVGETPEAEWKVLTERLTDAYMVFRRVMKPEGFLYVLDYPIPFDRPGRACATRTAVGLADTLRLNLFTGRLNEAISDAITEAGSRLSGLRERPPNIRLVAWRTRDTKDVPSFSAVVDGQKRMVPYNEDGLCGRDPLILGFAPTRTDRSFQDSFHPSEKGVAVAACRLAKIVHETQLRVLGFTLDPSGCA